MDFPHFIKILAKDCDMKKKLLVLLIAVIPSLMPNLASAMAIDVGEPSGEYWEYSCYTMSIACD